MELAEHYIIGKGNYNNLVFINLFYFKFRMEYNIRDSLLLTGADTGFLVECGDFFTRYIQGGFYKAREAHAFFCPLRIVI